MPSTIAKTLHLCFMKIKIPITEPPDLSPSPTHRFLFENYNSLFEPKASPRPPSSSSSSGSEPDFATVFASQRFFFSSPGHSNSIIESTTESPNSLKCDNSCFDSVDSLRENDTVAVPTYSPDPYLDFRRSMQEMVEARDLLDVKANWHYLHELLLSYLALNPKSAHQFVIRAFADLVVSLLASS